MSSNVIFHPELWRKGISRAEANVNELRLAQ